ncbi:GNAT family N-acetyltransferase [Clostridium neuense]|uniref:GNAT family N-acetyltransferase n=1 Tax=Clostridium neuense TaxID=1728934 RepID=A0ABW8TER2_9CLOT
MCEIRYANVHDANVLGEIHSSSWKAAYRGIIPDKVLDNITAEKREKYFKKALREAIEEDAIIFEGSKAAGFICIGKCRDKDKDISYGEICGLYLLPDYWHRGLGLKLINWGLVELEKRNYKKITLWVLEENLNARRFYEKVGFKFDGTVNEINIGKKLNEVRYVKKLISEDGEHL